MKKDSFINLAFLVILLLVALIFTACGAEQPSADPVDEETVDEDTAVEEETVRVADFLLVRANEYEQAKSDGIESMLNEFNAEVDTYACEFDTQEQINQIQDAITMGVYDAFIIWPNDSNAVVPIIEEAVEAGIVVIGVGVIGPDTRSLEPYPEGVTSIIANTGWGVGTWLGRAVVDAADGQPAKVAYLMGSQAFTVDQDRYEALLEVIEDYPEIEVVSLQEGAYRRDTSREVMQNVFQANPDINIIVSSGDQMTLGAFDAAEDMGIADNIKFIGNGCSIQGWEAIRDGKLFGSYADIPYTQGQIALEMAVRAVRGEDVPPTIDLEHLSPPHPASGPLITIDVIDEFDAQW